jgi:hypothetical protein
MKSAIKKFSLLGKGCIIIIKYRIDWPDERETKDVLDSGGYNRKDDNNAYGIRKLNLK